jgi:cytochrome c
MNQLRLRPLLLSAALLSAALLWGCSEPNPGPEPLPDETPVASASPQATKSPAPSPAGPVDLVPGEVQEVLDLDCASCHSGADASAGLRLDAQHAYAALLDQKSTQASKMRLVAPGEPKDSYLLHKMRGTHLDVGGHGDRMPIEGSWGVHGSLSDAEVLRVEKWISNGAPAEE